MKTTATGTRNFLKDEAPDVYAVVREAYEFRTSHAPNFIDEAVLSAHLLKSSALTAEAISKSEAYELPEAAKQRFRDAVESVLNDNSLLGVPISFSSFLCPINPTVGDWFSRTDLLDGSALDASICFTTFHPELTKLSLEEWGEHPRFQREETPTEASLDPVDGAWSWNWHYYALKLANRAAQEFDYGLSLSDFVVWTCSGRPVLTLGNPAFGEPALFAHAGFGDMPEGLPQERRLDGALIWDMAEGSFVSPLWEYMAARRYPGAQDFISNCIASICRGIDAARRSARSMNPAPVDGDEVNRLHGKIFSAGEAFVELRLKIEAEEAIRLGRARAEVNARAGRGGGTKSSKSREQRRSGLLSAMEKLAKENPAFLQLPPENIARVARNYAAEADKKTWAQGRNQFLEYLGEIRRGEAGEEAKARYESLFPQKPPKRLPTERGTA